MQPQASLSAPTHLPDTGLRVWQLNKHWPLQVLSHCDLASGVGGAGGGGGSGAQAAQKLG